MFCTPSPPGSMPEGPSTHPARSWRQNQNPLALLTVFPVSLSLPQSQS